MEKYYNPTSKYATRLLNKPALATKNRPNQDRMPKMLQPIEEEKDSPESSFVINSDEDSDCKP